MLQLSNTERLMPKLRFPGFSGEWRASKIDDVAEVRGGKRIPKGYSLQTQKNDSPYITVSDMRDGTVSLTDIKYVPDAIKSVIRNYKIYVGDIYISVAGTLGLVGTIPAGLDGANLTENADKLTNLRCNQYYLLQYLKSERFTKLINNVKTDNAQPKLAIYSIKSFEISLPDKAEQRKIAEFLTAVDDRVGLSERRLELLKKYKQGVMQKIFTQQIRFKDSTGKTYPNWGEKELGEIGDTYNGLSGKGAEDFGSGLPYITYMQIFGSSSIDIGGFSYVQIKAGEKQSRVKKGDIFFTTSSETPEEVGFASVLLDNAGELYLNSFCFGYRQRDQQNLLPEFAQFLFRSKVFRHKVMRLAQGSTRYNLSKAEFMKVAVALPPIDEQRKIAGFLTALDDKIKLEESKLEQARNFKKCLLQQMFV